MHLSPAERRFLVRKHPQARYRVEPHDRRCPNLGQRGPTNLRLRIGKLARTHRLSLPGLAPCPSIYMPAAYLQARASHTPGVAWKGSPTTASPIATVHSSEEWPVVGSWPRVDSGSRVSGGRGFGVNNGDVLWRALPRSPALTGPRCRPFILAAVKRGSAHTGVV